MRTSNFNSLFPKVFGGALDTLLSSGLSDIVGSDFNLSSPSVNVIELENKYKIEMAAPGLTKEDFNIEIEGDQLKISSHFEKSEEEKKEDNYLRREFSYQSFVRSFTLPKTIEKDSISAVYNDGILSIELLKMEEAIEKGPVKISIK